MRTITMNVYKFDELSETAKRYARNTYRENAYEDYDEYGLSIKAIGQVLGMRPDWEISLCSHSYVKFERNLDEEIEELTGVRALKWVWNNWIEKTLRGKVIGKLFPCEKSKEHPTGLDYKFYYSKATKEFSCPFTGFTMDMVFMETYQHMQEEVREGKEPDIDDFLKDLESRLCEDWLSEIEYRDSDEYIDEMIEANDYEFYENGVQL